MKLSILSPPHFKRQAWPTLINTRQHHCQAPRYQTRVLETHIAFEEGSELVLLNTHLEAFSKQSDTLKK
jgi:hypothetical protein